VAYELIGRGAGGAPNKWAIFTAPIGGGFGVPPNSLSVFQYPANGVPGCCLQRFTILPAATPGDTGGTLTIDQNGNASQARTAGGMVKAMMTYDGFPARILSCFNSTRSGAFATTPNCGFAVDKTGTGDYIVDFGFQVDDRFLSLTLALAGNVLVNGFVCTDQHPFGCVHTLTPNQVEVIVSTGQSYGDNEFYLIVY